jgi:hypothetical protein
LKPVVIIAIAVVCSVIAVLSIQFISNNSNEIVSTLTFDCAKQYDQLGDKTYSDSMTTEEGKEIFETFLKNKCASTVDDWKERSKYQDNIKDANWDLMKYLEQQEIEANP